MRSINITRNSPTHLALLYLKMKSLHFSTKEQIYNLSPSKFKNASKFNRSLDLLLRSGFAFEKNGCYAITPAGQTALRQIVREQPSKESKS